MLRVTLILSLLCVAAIVGCGGPSDPPYEPPDTTQRFVGKWTGTSTRSPIDGWTWTINLEVHDDHTVTGNIYANPTTIYTITNGTCTPEEPMTYRMLDFDIVRTGTGYSSYVRDAAWIYHRSDAVQFRMDIYGDTEKKDLIWNNWVMMYWTGPLD